jgi:hypothetical protein
MEQNLCSKACSRPDSKQFLDLFMQFESSLPCSREPTTGTGPETSQSSPAFTLLYSRLCLEVSMLHVSRLNFRMKVSSKQEYILTMNIFNFVVVNSKREIRN